MADSCEEQGKIIQLPNHEHGTQNSELSLLHEPSAEHDFQAGLVGNFATHGSLPKIIQTDVYDRFFRSFCCFSVLSRHDQDALHQKRLRVHLPAKTFHRQGHH